MSDPTHSFAPPPIPAPVQALPYSIPVGQGRPGIITAIGVLSIVVASLSGITSLGTGFYSFIFYAMGKSMATISAASSSSVSSTVSVATTLPPGDVGVAVNTLKPMLSLDGAHVRELDNLLRKHGRQVLGGDDDTRLTLAGIQGAVSKVIPQRGGSIAPAQVTTSEGLLRIYSDRAIFDVADGGATVNTSAKHQTDQTTQAPASGMTVTSGSSPLSSSTTLTAAQVAAVLAGAQAGASPAMNASQIQSLQAAVSAPNQTLVTPGALTPIASTFVVQGGNATLTFDTGSMLVLGPAGQVISSGPVAIPSFNINGPLVAVLVVEAIASVALAIFLLVLGIMVFRASFGAGRLLRLYAWVKIPLALVAGVASAMFAYQFGLSIAATSSPGAPPGQQGFIISAVVMVILGLAFPIGLLIALRTRTVRDYYNAVQPGY